MAILRWLGKAMPVWSAVFVREGRRQVAVGIGLRKQSTGLGFEGLHGVCARGKACGGFLEASELHKSVGELGGVAALLSIHAAPRGDGFSCARGVVVDVRLGERRGV